MVAFSKLTCVASEKDLLQVHIEIDCSGSTKDYFQSHMTPAAATLIKHFLRMSNVEIAVGTFDHTHRDFIPFTSDAKKLIESLSGLRCWSGGTHFGAAAKKNIEVSGFEDTTQEQPGPGPAQADAGSGPNPVPNPAQQNPATTTTTTTNKAPPFRPATTTTTTTNNAPSPPVVTQRTNVRRIFVIITDGKTDPDHLESTIRKFDLIKENSTLVWTLGIVSEELHSTLSDKELKERTEAARASLSRFASSENCVFLYRDFGDIIARIGAIGNNIVDWDGDESNASELAVSFGYTERFHVGSPHIKLTVKVENIGEEVTQSGTLVLYTRESPYFIASKARVTLIDLEPDDEMHFEITIRSKSGVGVYELCLQPYLQFALQFNNRRICTDVDVVQLVSHMFTGAISRWNFPQINSLLSSRRRLKLVFMGTVGIGKSSTINTALSATSGRERFDAHVQLSSGSTTRSVSTYPIDSIQNVPLTVPFDNTDVWGIEDQDNVELQCPPQFVRKLICGYIRDNFTSVGENLDDKLEDCTEHRPEDEVDCLLYFVSAASLNDPFVAKKVTEICTVAQNCHKLYAVVVTCPDSVFPDKGYGFVECFNPENPFRKELLNDIRSVDPQRVFFVCNDFRRFGDEGRMKHHNQFARDMAIYELFNYVHTNYEHAQLTRALNTGDFMGSSLVSSLLGSRMSHSEPSVDSLGAASSVQSSVLASQLSNSGLNYAPAPPSYHKIRTRVYFQHEGLIKVLSVCGAWSHEELANIVKNKAEFKSALLQTLEDQCSGTGNESDLKARDLKFLDRETGEVLTVEKIVKSGKYGVRRNGGESKAVLIVLK